MAGARRRAKRADAPLSYNFEQYIYSKNRAKIIIFGYKFRKSLQDIELSNMHFSGALVIIMICILFYTLF